MEDARQTGLAGADRIAVSECIQVSQTADSGAMTVTGYVRKYAMWVLNHAEEVLQIVDAPPQRYGSEVQQALVLIWETLNRICANPPVVDPTKCATRLRG